MRPNPKPVPVAQPGPAEPIYVTVDQVAAMLQVSPFTVYSWVRVDLTMPCLRIGGVLRFHRERLMKWLHQREQGNPRTRQLRSCATPPSRKPAPRKASAEDPTRA